MPRINSRDGRSGRSKKRRRRAVSDSPSRSESPRRHRRIRNPAEENYTIDEWKYYSSLKGAQKKDIAEREANVIKKYSEIDGGSVVPLRFRMLMSEHMPDEVKALALARYSALSSSLVANGEFCKLCNWMDMLSRLPFDRHRHVGPRENTPAGIAAFLKQVRAAMDGSVYGHDEVKREIVNFVAQKIVNPRARGRVLCLSGPPGIAKTQLARAGIAKALGLPFSTIALGGANDGSFLDGHVFTYEGSRPGIIAKELIKAECNNPVLFFDELDKVSYSHRGGDEITNILLHVTDPTQNEQFRDKYFSEVPIDISKAFVLFSCNDTSQINHILKDRLTILRMHPYDSKQKIVICKNHLLPDIASEFGWPKNESIEVDDDTIKYVINEIPEEDGVRGLKKTMHACVAEWVAATMLHGKTGVNDLLPVRIDRVFIDKHLAKSYRKDGEFSGRTLSMYI